MAATFLCVWTLIFACADLLGTPTKADEPPVLQPLLIPTQLTLGDRADIVCALKRGSLPVTFAWRLNGRPLAPERSKVHASDRRSLVFLGEGIRPEDVGNYSCTATNDYGQDTVWGMLLVEVAPFWNVEPTDAHAARGTNVRLDCDVTAHPFPRITWTRQDSAGHAILVRNDTRHEVYGNGTMIIYEVNESDAGAYTCDVGNGIGDPLRKEIYLHVLIPPSMKEGFRAVTVRRGQTARLECDVIGDLPLDVIWYRKKLKVEPQPGSRYDVRHENTTDGVKAILTVHASQPSDAGLYLCRVNNQFGDAQGRVKVLVQEPPDPPTGLEVTRVASRSAEVSWQLSLPRSRGESPILSHVLRYWVDKGGGGGADSETQQMALSDVDNSAELRDLRPGTTYAVVVLAENEVGYSEPSDTLRFTTREEAPASAPQNVRADGFNTTTLRITWEPPPVEDRNGELRGYRVWFRSVEDARSPRGQVTAPATGSDREFVDVGGLEPGTSYRISVSAFNSAGPGPESEPILGETPDKDPPEPPLIALSEVTAFSALLQLQGSSATRYVLEYREPEKNEEWTLIHIPGGQASYLLSGLKAGARYELRLAAFNEFGQGQFGPSTLVETGDPLSSLVASTGGAGKKAGQRPSAPAESASILEHPYVLVPLVLVGLVSVAALVVGTWLCVRRRRTRATPSKVLKQEPSPRTNGSFTNSAATTYTRAEDFDAPWNVNHHEDVPSRYAAKSHART